MNFEYIDYCKRIFIRKFENEVQNTPMPAYSTSTLHRKKHRAVGNSLTISEDPLNWNTAA